MIKKLFYKFHKWVWSYQEQEQAGTNIGNMAIREGNEADIEGMRFTVMPARGGTIVQLRTYDRRKDESNHITYVIPEGDDIAQEVGRIVSMEMLKA
jgi:hypothetical protein